MEQQKLEYQEESIKYCLGEMTPHEEEAYESRMFAEPEVAADIQSLEFFRTAVRDAEAVQPAAAAAHAQPTEPAAWVKWLQGLFRPEVLIPSAAALSLGIVVISQNLVPQGTPVAGEPQQAVMPAFALPSVTLSGMVRGVGESSDLATLPAGARGYHLAMYLDTPEAFEAYDVEIRTVDGEFRYRSEVQLGETGNISLFVPGDNMGVGEYELVVKGREANAAAHSGEAAATASFRVE